MQVELGVFPWALAVATNLAGKLLKSIGASTGRSKEEQSTNSRF
jgi:hypothetical protein